MLSKKATEIDVKKLDRGEALIKMDVYNDGEKDVPSEITNSPED